MFHLRTSPLSILKHGIFSLALTLSAFTGLHAAPQAQALEWRVGDKTFSGYLVYDDADKHLRPGLVMAPDWMGVTPAALDRAKAIAGTQYVILLADYYGKDIRPKNGTEAGQLASALRGGDRAQMRERIHAAVQTLKDQASHAPVDASKIAAFGFCLGGTTVLELARMGEKLAGIVTFHGDLSATRRAAANSIATPLLILNGADDKYVTAQDRAAFEQEMTQGGADWQLVNFSGTVHCFALPAVGNDPASNCRYNERSARRAYKMMNDFLSEVFAR